MEAVNSPFKIIRRFPIINCLMETELYVDSKWAENVSKVNGWGVLTPFTSRNVDKIVATAALGKNDVSSTSCFVVAIRSGVGVNLVKFAVKHFTRLFDARVGTSRMLALLVLMLYLRFDTLKICPKR